MMRILWVLYEPDYSHISQKVRFCVPPSARMETLHLMRTLKLCITGENYSWEGQAANITASQRGTESLLNKKANSTLGGSKGRGS